MRAEQLHEALARDRRRYERLVHRRFHGGVSWEDAEDIVSDALLRAHSRVDSEPPEHGKESAWFTRIVFNQAVDFLRARDGRRREGSRPRPGVVSLTELEEAGAELPDAADGAGAGEAWIEALDREGEQAQARTIVARVLSRVPPKDADLIKLRHLLGADAPREQVAAMAGLTLGEFRWRYARAWERFVDAMAAEQPTVQCQRIRLLIGGVEAGTAEATACAEIDAHVLACPSCQVFARDSCRALELLPFAPTVGVAEHWVARLAGIWERSNPEVAAGGGAVAATGAGASGLAGAGGVAGSLKTLAAICGATAATAGVCGSVLLTVDGSDDRRQRGAAPVTAKPADASTMTTRVVAAKSSASSASSRSSTPSRRTATSTQNASLTSPPDKPIPASAPVGSQEFAPSGAGGPVQPASTPAAGGGEFSP